MGDPDQLSDLAHDVADAPVISDSAFPPSVNAGIPRLGATPVRWTRVSLGDLLEVVERPAKLENDKTYRLVTAKRSRGGIVARSEMRGDVIRVKQQFYVRAGDFILSNRQISHGGCGIVPISLDGAIVSGEYTVLKSRGDLDLRYLDYLSHLPYFQQVCFHSSVGVHVEKLVFRLDQWLDWPFNIPPLSEQRRIIEILGQSDRAIAATDALIEAKRRRKRALVRQVLMRPSDEATIRLGSLGSFVKGKGITKAELVASGVPCLRYAEIYTAYDNVACQLKSRVSEANAGASVPLSVGDLVFAASGETALEIGKAIAYLGNEPAVVGGDTVVLKGHGQDPSFLAHLLNADDAVRQKAELGKGHSVVHIHAPDLSKIEIWLPPIDRQQAVAKIFACMDKEIDLLFDQATALRLQRRGLRHKLLTGDWLIAKPGPGAVAA